MALYAPATPRNLMVISDFQASDTGSPIEVTWTNPDYMAFTSVRVMWSEARYPTSVTDGEEVFSADAMEPGASAQATVGGPSSGYFAIFAGDAAGNWTLGAFEGFNADQGMATGIGAADRREDPGEGLGEDAATGPEGSVCGCRSGARPRAGWTWLLSLSGLWVAGRSRGAGGVRASRAG